MIQIDGGHRINDFGEDEVLHMQKGWIRVNSGRATRFTRINYVATRILFAKDLQPNRTAAWEQVSEQASMIASRAVQRQVHWT